MDLFDDMDPCHEWLVSSYPCIKVAYCIMYSINDLQMKKTIAGKMETIEAKGTTKTCDQLMMIFIK